MNKPNRKKGENEAMQILKNKYIYHKQQKVLLELSKDSEDKLGF